MTALAFRVSFFFAARIREAARRAGATLVQADQGSLAEEAERAKAELVLLEIERADLAEIALLKARPALAGARVVGFGAHVQEELFARAREAGCDAVYAKGELGRRLEELFRPA
jgi:AmiR/NasT family two-component response regulator